MTFSNKPFSKIIASIWTIYILAMFGISPGDSVQYNNMRFQVQLQHDNWAYLQALVGSLHQLKEGPQKVPFMIISTKFSLNPRQKEESAFWTRVQFTSELLADNQSILIPTGFVCDAAGLAIRKAELITDPDLIIRARALGREKMQNSTIANIMNNFIPLNDSSPELKCHIDINPEVVKFGAEPASEADYAQLERLKNETLPIVAIGVPTTSKGMKVRKEKSVLLRFLLPSIQRTVSLSELEHFKLIVMIGIDKGDPVFDNIDFLQRLRSDAAMVLPMNVIVIFVRLKRIQRVATLWNMIFSLAYDHGVTWFYQVNDDLTMESLGWLTRFTSALSDVNGFGVAGPSDSFQDFRCSILTQAFIHRSHFERFGYMYPLDFRDWKSDRWLSFVYGEGNTFCWPDIRVHNGAVGTRYSACPYQSWRVVLQRTQQQLLSSNRSSIS